MSVKILEVSSEQAPQQLSLRTQPQHQSPPPRPPVSHAMDSELNIVMDELGEAAMVRARHSPLPSDM
ncbi:hypothetical protein F2Q70_00044699 [Brassica cretica]|uniref:Uncharacterized protein n=1 Tax=Brassica cretica TaxID=69181 RepID=A0A8S9KFK9_BRACR|nr:hypothetical protein F2Q70_00044699 [Brassica cretica]